MVEGGFEAQNDGFFKVYAEFLVNLERNSEIDMEKFVNYEGNKVITARVKANK
jgi:hypothetical protein